MGRNGSVVTASCGDHDCAIVRARADGVTYSNRWKTPSFVGVLPVFGLRQARRAGRRINRRCKFLTVCNSYTPGVNRFSVAPQPALPARKPGFLGGPFVRSAFFVGSLAAQSGDGASLFEAH